MNYTLSRNHNGDILLLEDGKIVRWVAGQGTGLWYALIGMLEKVTEYQEALAQQGKPATEASRDVLLERWRQVSAEGWTPEHDDEEHAGGDLVMAGACYAAFTSDSLGVGTPNGWPWATSWWKPKSRRHGLVRAAALIIAEIERLDRADGKVKP